MEHTNVKILAISDVPSKALWDYDTRARLEGIDLILSCGDLPKSIWNISQTLPLHPSCMCTATTMAATRLRGTRRLHLRGRSGVHMEGAAHHGAGGCQRYNKEDTYQYTEKAMRRRVHKLKHQAHKGAASTCC